MAKPQKTGACLPKLDFTNKKQGIIALLTGIVLALVFASSYGEGVVWVYWVLAIGVVVGILNMFHEEAISFLISGLTITFMLTIFAGSPFFPELALKLFSSVVYVLAPANIIVALKVLYALATK